jgi:hypothetical protein
MIIAINWLQLYIDMAQNAEVVAQLLDDMNRGKKYILKLYYNSKVIE